MNKKGIVIAGFAGVGKTTLAKKYSNVIDIESSPYKWDYRNIDTSNLEVLKGLKTRTLNKDFPQNYIDKINEARLQYDVVLVWIHPEDILPYYDKYNIDYCLCFPSKEALIEYRDRFINRGNNLEYINKVLGDYDLRYEQFIHNPHPKIILSLGETLEDALLKMKLLDDSTKIRMK